jgi:hypothetical protein
MQKHEGKRLLERRSRRWKDNIKMYFQEMRWGHGLIDMAQIETSSGLL